MTHLHKHNRRWIQRLIAPVIGLTAGVLLWLTAVEGYRPSLLQWIISSYQHVGITIIAFVPLTIWALKTIIFDRRDGLTLAYLGNQAKDFGFLGTIIGVMIMYAALGVSIKSGEAGAVQKAVSGFAQAASSTAIGLVISTICKHFQYLSMKAEEKNDFSQEDAA